MKASVLQHGKQIGFCYIRRKTIILTCDKIKSHFIYLSETIASAPAKSASSSPSTLVAGSLTPAPALVKYLSSVREVDISGALVFFFCSHLLKWPTEI